MNAIKKYSIFTLMLLVSVPISLNANAKECKEIDDNWSWFGDHIVSSISYAVALPEGRNIEVGTGIMLFGNPRGSRYKLTESTSVVAIGFGSIYVRSNDDSSVKVCVDSSGASAITIYKQEF